MTQLFGPDTTVLHHEATIWRVEIVARSLYRIVADGIERSALYFLEGTLARDKAEALAEMLLADPVTEHYHLSSIEEMESRTGDPYIEVTLLPGVTDAAAENLIRAAQMAGFDGLQRVATGQRYHLSHPLPPHELEMLAADRLYNPIIQRASFNTPIAPPFVPVQPVDPTVEYVRLIDANDQRLLAINAERRLALDLNELRTVRDYFEREGRNPTDAEIEMIAQTWSEHCVHKTFKARIEYSENGGESQIIDGLLKTYIGAATDEIGKSWVRSAFVDNAGIIAFDDQFDLAFKVETHNHPSALEPFGGANTGVGGVVRDVLGVSAKPIANTDILCFGFPDTSHEALPEGVLHPARIAEGVVKGVEDYGNKMGIPTVNGAVLYHEGYTANPLVFCGCVGLLPHGAHVTGAQPGDLIVVLGGRTGRDGLRGATFSSMEMDVSTGEIAGSSVQIGNPIMEKQVQEVILRLRDAGLYHAITDCGAGGLSSAVGEMAADLGAEVQLETVPLKYAGLRPWEIWLSEAQERMVIAVAPEHWAEVQHIAAGQDVPAACTGTFNDSGRLTLAYDTVFVGDLSLDFLHDGIPQRQLKAVWQPTFPLSSYPSIRYPSQWGGEAKHSAAGAGIGHSLISLLAHPNIRSKEAIIRKYDHIVQGGSALTPLTGSDNAGPGDAAVLVPIFTQTGEAPKGVAVSNGINPLYGEIDPYAMAWAAVDEAVRNAVACGADPDQIAILDNFCWGNPNLPDRLGALVRCAQGCHDAALAYGTPFISGKDSLNNEYTGADGQKHAIPGTLLISAIGIVPDVTKSTSSDFKQAGNAIYLIGQTRDELGGSHYALLNPTNGAVPSPNPDALKTMRALHRAIQTGLVKSCHDLSEGGLAVALAEMCIGGGLGAEITISSNLDPETFLYSETLTRFLVEIAPDQAQDFEAAMQGVSVTRLGVTSEDTLVISTNGHEHIRETVTDLEKAWRGEVASATASRVQVTTGIPQHPRRSYSTRKPRVMIMHANGSNRDHDAALAVMLAGGEPEIVHVNQLASGEDSLIDYQMLIVPGGFSYGDDLGAGVLWAQELRLRLGDQMRRFIEAGKPVIGICNGFQTLVKSGWLPGTEFLSGGSTRPATLTFNQSGHFECRWVTLEPVANSVCLFTEGLSEPILCPVAHGEGRFLTADEATLDALVARNMIALIYSQDSYPDNPNGSARAIAGICNAAGNVFGLMPHPENHVFGWQHPRWRRGERGMDGLRIFENGIRNS